MAIANYEDRFVIPTAHREIGEDAYDLRGSCGFTFGNGCSGGESETNLFGTPQARPRPRWRSCDDKTFKALSALLTYPTAELQRGGRRDSRGDLDAEALVPAAGRARSSHLLIDEIATGDLYDLQERYVLLFDRTRSLSLHLFEHVHGESRDRGQAMVDLKAHVREGRPVHRGRTSCRISCRCSWNSCRRCRREARELLGQPAHIFAALAERLRKRQSAYEAVFRCAGRARGGEADGARSSTTLLTGARSGPDGSCGARCRLGGGGGHASARAPGAGLQGRP